MRTARCGGWVTRGLCCSTVAVLVLLSGGGTPLEGAPSAREFPDPPCLDPRLAVSDLQRATVAVDGGDYRFTVVMQRPLAEGIFTRANVEFDCDGRRSDTEVETHHAVGSRYRPSSFVPADGAVAPLQLIRGSWASAFDERAQDFSTRRRLVHQGALTAPEVHGRELRFSIPTHLPDERGALRATSPPAMRIVVETACADHPVSFDYDAIGKGREVKVDGSPQEWSGGPYATDPVGELHESLQFLDLREVWCEHGPEKIFLRIDLARPGFGDRTLGADRDIQCLDYVRVLVEPRGEQYMEPVDFRIPADGSEFPLDGVSWSARNGVLEIAVDRHPNQTRLRVTAWAEAWRFDTVTPEWIPVREGRGGR